MEPNKNQKAVDWLILELSKKGFFNVSTASFPEFKGIIEKAQSLENKQIVNKKRGIMLYSFSLN